MRVGNRVSIALVGMALVAGCGRAESSSSETAEMLYLRSATGVTVVQTGAPSASFEGKRAVPSADWTTVVRAEVHGETTDVIATDPATGAGRWTREAQGKLRPKVVSSDGTLAVLSPRSELNYGYGRAETKLVITGKGLTEARVVTLEGNYEPEAFSSDGESLFLVSYLPAIAPLRYQVRLLDISTGQVGGVYTPHDELQRPMGGTARVQTGSPDGRRLYTLYTIPDRRGFPKQSFIHVLDLDEKWAHCIDLPKGFETAADIFTTLSVSPDGKRLFVANSLDGALAEVDVEGLQVVRSTEATLEQGPAHSATSEDTLFVASRRSVSAFDRSDLRLRWSVKVAGRIRGLQLVGEQRKLYAALKKDVVSLDASSGETLDTLDPPGIGVIDRLGPVLGIEPEAAISCAC